MPVMNATVPPDTPGTISAAPIAIPLRNTEAGCCVWAEHFAWPSCCRSINGQPHPTRARSEQVLTLAAQTDPPCVSPQPVPGALHRQVLSALPRQQADPKALGGSQQGQRLQ